MASPSVVDFDTDEAAITQRINELARPLEVLEAGCGRRWTLRLDAPYRLTGIDQDARALEARQRDQHDLDQAICGDLRTVALPSETFDVIYCSFVLEHVSGAALALENFARWLRPGGILVIKVPDRSSMYGLAARITPFWFHVWFYRRVRGSKAAGTPGHPPYPTHHDPVTSRIGIADFCRERDLILETTRQVDNYLRGNTVLRAAGWVVGAISLGRVPWRWNDLTFVVSKPRVAADP